MVYVGIFLCFVPLILCFFITTFGFKLKISHQLIAILLGLVAVVPISFIQFLLPSLKWFENYPVLHALIKSIFLYGFVEELVKMLLILPLPHKDYDSFNSLMLSFVFGIAIGSFESVVYFLDHLQLSHMYGGELLYGLILLRIFSSDIIHLTCAGLCGLFVFSCRNKPPKLSIFMIAVLLHGVYDFFAGFQNNLRWFAIPVIILAIIECRQKYVSVQNLAENRLTIFY